MRMFDICPFYPQKSATKDFYTFKTPMKHLIKSLMDKLFTISANITKCLSSELVACHRLEMMAIFVIGGQHLLQVGNVLYSVADRSQLRPSTASLYQLMCGKI